MKVYLKHTVLFLLYHPVSYLAGGHIAGLPSILLGAIFEANRDPITNIVQPILVTIIPLLFLFFFLQRDSYNLRRFSPLMIIGSAVPLFAYQLICILHKNLGMLAVGGIGIVTKAIFPNTDNVLHYVVVQIGLWLLVYLPTYLFASYYGYKRRVKENEKMIKEYEEQTQ